MMLRRLAVGMTPGAAKKENAAATPPVVEEGIEEMETTTDAVNEKIEITTSEDVSASGREIGRDMIAAAGATVTETTTADTWERCRAMDRTDGLRRLAQQDRAGQAETSQGRSRLRATTPMI